MSWSNRFRKVDVLATPYRAFRNVISGRGWGAFHHDPIYRKMMLDLLESFPFSSFVETGTYRGYSTEFIAARRPDLPVFTSEVMEVSYQIARRALRRYRTVTQFQGSSDKIVAGLVEGRLRGADGRGIGTHPLFFLDAHWQRYWPLRDELRHISAARMRTVIVIDDFEVPGQPQFEFDVDGGGDVVEGEKCNLDYIRVALSPENVYQAVFPKYSRRDAYGSMKSDGLMRGHILLFQNLPEAYESFVGRPHARGHYFGHGPVPTGPSPAISNPAAAN